MSSTSATQSVWIPALCAWAERDNTQTLYSGAGPVQLRLKKLKVNPTIGSSHQQISWLITSLFPVTLLAPRTGARANSSRGLFLNCTHFGLHSPIKLCLSIWYICTWKATPAPANWERFCDEKSLNMLQMNTSIGQSKSVWNHIFSCGTFWNRISNSPSSVARWLPGGWWYCWA